MNVGHRTFNVERNLKSCSVAEVDVHILVESVVDDVDAEPVGLVGDIFGGA